MEAARAQLTTVLAGKTPAPGSWGWDADPWLALAWGEGVTALVSARLDHVVDLPSPIRERFGDQSRLLAAASLRPQQELRRVFAALEAAGIPFLVLKGVALAHWLYPAPYLREFSDADLLFASRDDAQVAARVLAPLGYSMPYEPSRFSHELTCRAGDGALDLDMHWRLSDWPVLAHLPPFETLMANSRPLTQLGPAARRLGAGDALLHACVHRASNLVANLGDRLKWLYDVHLLAGVLAPADWSRLVQECTRAQVCGLCAEGLQATIAAFATPVPAEVLQALRDRSAAEPLDAARLHDWRYLQRLNFLALPSWRERMGWLGSRLFPPTGYLRELYGEGSRGSLLLRRLERAFARVWGRG